MGHSVALHLMEVSCKDENLEQEPVKGIAVRVRHVCFDSKQGSLAVFRFWLRVSLRSIISVQIFLSWGLSRLCWNWSLSGSKKHTLDPEELRGPLHFLVHLIFCLPFLLIFTFSRILIKVKSKSTKFLPECIPQLKPYLCLPSIDRVKD